MGSFRLKPAWVLALLLWFGAIAAGHAWLLRYSFTAGNNTAAPQTLPLFVAAPATSPRAQLLVALNPHCPCSRATLSELARILTRAPGASDVTVLMYKPANEPESWIEGALLDECRRMSYRVRPDPDGRLAAALGGVTSGVIALYDATGRLRYQGGITASRGHEGDNAGERMVIEILRGRRGGEKFMPVFGCPIQTQTSARRYP